MAISNHGKKWATKPRPKPAPYWWLSFTMGEEFRGVAVVKALGHLSALSECVGLVDHEWDVLIYRMDDEHKPAKKYLNKLLTGPQVRDMMAPYGEVGGQD